MFYNIHLLFQHCYMSYGCVHKSFKAPKVNVEVSDFQTAPPPAVTQPPRITKPGLFLKNQNTCSLTT